MMPLLKMQIERDENGEIIHAETKPLIRGKKPLRLSVRVIFAASSSALLFNGA